MIYCLKLEMKKFRIFELNFRKPFSYLGHLSAAKEESLHCRGLEDKEKLN